MALEVQESVREGVTVLSLRGRLTAGDCDVLRDKLNDLIAANRVQVVMDLSALDYIDSTGLGNLVLGYTSLRKQGGSLKLVNLNKRNLELLLLTKLHTVFEVFDDVQEAVNSFFPERAIKRFDILAFVREQKSGG